jgi:malonyl-CoA/methylmalonyl-CoA synthetase
MLAVVRAGGVLLPLNTGYTPEDISYFVRDSEAAVMVDDDRLSELSEVAAGLAPTFDWPDAEPDDLAALLYTSGTTGRPKGAMLTQRNLASNADVLHRLWGFTGDDVLLHALPIFHTHGLWVALNCVLASGASMCFLPRFDVDTVLDALQACTVMMGVPTYYTRLLEEPRFDGGDVRLYISGSAPLLASTHEEFTARTGRAILERYGMTETGMLTSNPVDGERRPGTVGFPIPGTDVRIGDDEVVEVHGPNVFAGYWGRPELAETEFTVDGWFRTGDVGRFDDDGYLHLIGRAKDLVITGGLNVYPVEIEGVIDALDGVLESAVIGLPDADLGEAVVAVVVPEPGVVLDPEAVRLAARDRLAGFKSPKRVEVVDALPRNAMGKVEKATLRATFSGE